MTKKRDTPTQPLPDWMIGPCAETQGADVAEVVEAQREAMIGHMVNRFLSWRLPENFAPDEGISFNPEYNVEYNAAHNKLPHVAQTMYDIAEAALSDTSECGTPRGEAGDRAGPPVSPHTAKLGADDGK